MKGKNGVKFFAVIISIALLTYLALYGFVIGGFKIPSAKDIRLGIDIKGGIHATLYAVKADKSKPTDKELETAKAIIGKRLDKKGISDRNITIDKTGGRVIVEIPWKSNEKDFNPQKALDELGETALLTFQEVDETKRNPENGDYLPTGKIVVQGTEIVKAEPDTDPENGGMLVSLELSNQGAKKFSEATGRLIGKPIAIFLDNQLVSAPVVNAQISTGKAVITLGGSNNEEKINEARELAATINAGALPFKLVAKEVNAVSPLLGEGALKVSVQAGMVALLLVWLFMLLYYRLPGMLANIALLAHTVIQLLFIAWIPVINLSLPGIAGVILSIGMGVDANVIIFERIKEELKNGKTLRAAIDVGFKRAFSAILDANMTTLISAVFLGVFGTGAIRGFAYTLGLGVVLSFLTAIIVSRIMLKSVSDLDIAKHHWLYGV